MTTTTHGNSETGKETTTDRLAAKAHETVDSVAERAQRAEREIRGAASRTAEHTREVHDQAAAKAEQSVQRVASYFEGNPLACAGIAFVAGVLLVTMLRR